MKVRSIEKKVSKIANSSHLKINFVLHFGLSHFGWFIHVISSSIKFALHIRHLDAFLIELFQHTQKSIPYHQLIRNEIPQREKMKVNKVPWTGKLQVNLIYLQLSWFLQIDDFRCVHWLTLKVNGIYWNELGWNQTGRKRWSVQVIWQLHLWSPLEESLYHDFSSSWFHRER